MCEVVTAVTSFPSHTLSLVHRIRAQSEVERINSNLMLHSTPPGLVPPLHPFLCTLAHHPLSTIALDSIVDDSLIFLHSLLQGSWRWRGSRSSVNRETPASDLCVVVILDWLQAATTAPSCGLGEARYQSSLSLSFGWPINRELSGQGGRLESRARFAT